MASAFVAFGSNVDPETNVLAALRALADVAEVRAVSTFYRTPPQGTVDQPWFVNGVVEVATDLPREGLQARLRGVEDALGRVRGDDPNGPRTIDLDVAAYEDEDGAWLHDDVGRYAFVAGPVHELAPELGMVPPPPLEGTVALPHLTARLREAARRSGEG